MSNRIKTASQLIERMWREFTCRVERFRLAVDAARSLRSLRKLKAGLNPSQPLICIGLIEHFGDIVACEPVARYVRSQYPSACIVWITRERYRDLVVHHPDIDEVLTVKSLAAYDCILHDTPTDRFIDLHVNRRLCTEYGTLHSKRDGDQAIDVGNYYAFGSLLEAFCKSAGIPPLKDGPRFHFPPGFDFDIPGVIPKGDYLVIHAVSNETSRDWTHEKWAALVACLGVVSNITFVEVGTEPHIAPLSRGVVDLCGRLSLLQLAAVIRSSAGFLGVDSGPAHIANAFERPSLILLGSYRDFGRYMPYTGYLRDHASTMLIQWDGPAAEIPVEVAAAAAARVWPGRFSAISTA